MKYKIDKLLGKGSYGNVYLANNIQNNQIVAIKQFSISNKISLNSFKNEINI